MSVTNWVLWGIIGAVGIGILTNWLAPTAKLRRRRRKSHTLVATRARRPMVRFSAKVNRKKHK
jgi:hypothetical protein